MASPAMRIFVCLRRRQSSVRSLRRSIHGYVNPTLFPGSHEAGSSGSPAEDEVVRLASRPLHDLTLSDLVRFGRPPLSPPALLASARFTRENLPIRLSRRILALRNLPFIIVSNPHVSAIYNNYNKSLRQILAFPASGPTSLVEEVNFTGMLAEIVKTHTNTIPTLARGFLECKKYITAAEVTRFLDEHLRARIGTRLMAEQHIGLHLASTRSPDEGAEEKAAEDVPGDSFVGTVDTALQPAKIIRSCAAFVGDICEIRFGVRPQLRVDGSPDVRFPYIPVHLEYMITELLKNSFRATVEAGSPEPVDVTIVKDPGGEAITIRIRDHGGGIAPEHLPHIWSYSFSTFGGDDADSPNGDALGRFNESVSSSGDGSSIAGLGYGLPLSKAYAEYFGGSLDLVSLYGHGTDCYLKLKGVSVEEL